MQLGVLFSDELILLLEVGDFFHEVDDLLLQVGILVVLINQLLPDDLELGLDLGVRRRGRICLVFIALPVYLQVEGYLLI